MEEEKITDPIHPGEILLEEYLKPSQLSQNQLALKMRVPPQRISEIVRGKRTISPETAIRLGMVIGTTAKFWLSLQMDYDLQMEMNRSGDKVNKEIEPILM